MPVMIPDEILETTQMKPQEILRELAILLYTQERISLAQAAQLAQMGRVQFHHLLASRDIPINFGVEDLDSDLATLDRLDQS
jgi:predicted HTH domain antitoxin